MAEVGRLGSVEDGYNDVAQRASSGKMRVDATGRIPSQNCYLATTNPAKNIACDAKMDFLEGGPKLAEGSELVEAINTGLLLEVGLIYGKEPDKFLGSGDGQDKKRDAARKLRGT